MPAKRSLDWLVEASRKWRASTPSRVVGNVGYKSQTPGTVAPPPSSSTNVLRNIGDPKLTAALAQAKQQYELAKMRGDNAIMEAARREADTYRMLGANELAANQMVYGRESGWYPGWTLSSSQSNIPSTGGYLTPEFWQTLQQIEKYRRVNPPVYAPFPAGTPTLGRESYETSKEQWERKFARDILESDREYALNLRKAASGSQPKLSTTDIHNANLARLIDHYRSYLQKHVGDEASTSETLLAIHDMEKNLLKNRSYLISEGITDKDLQTILEDAFIYTGINPIDYVDWKKQTGRSTGLVERLLSQALEDAMLQGPSSSGVRGALSEQ